MSIYLIEHHLKYNDIYLILSLYSKYSNDNEVEYKVQNMLEYVFLSKEGLKIKYDNNIHLLTNGDKNSYDFYLALKENKHDVSLNYMLNMNQKYRGSVFSEKSNLLLNENYEKKNWNLSQAYYFLHQYYSSISKFYFSTISYMYLEIPFFNKSDIKLDI